MPTLPDNSFYCCYCGKRFSDIRLCTKDHLIPLSKGGVNNCYNKRNCCKHCNTQKGAMIPHDYLKYIEEKCFYSKRFFAQNVPIKIENIKFIIEYVNSAGDKLFRSKEKYDWFRRRYLTTN